MDSRHFSISSEQLLLDLYKAYKDARKNKRSKKYQLSFEFCLEENLISLRNALISGCYRPSTSMCFIIHEPKMREVFAAKFCDRIVHHLFYNYSHKFFERSFIYDSYSCIVGRGTHFGIERLKHHIRSVSNNFSQSCYVLKIDVRGYFMSIDRVRLLRIANHAIDIAYSHLDKNPELKHIDINFMKYLLEVVLCFNPVENCHKIGNEREWDSLPREKSLFYSAQNCGLPIGNLSSQLFSNVYMNVFDQYIKRILKCRHYGRYVDDAFIVSSNRQELKRLIPNIANFLENELGLKINVGKTSIFNAYHGVEFLGAYIKPFRTYISSKSLKRIYLKISRQKIYNPKQLQSSINSFLGVLSHYDCYCLRKYMFVHKSGLSNIGRFDNNVLKFYPMGRN